MFKCNKILLLLKNYKKGNKKKYNINKNTKQSKTSFKLKNAICNSCYVYCAFIFVLKAKENICKTVLSCLYNNLIYMLLTFWFITQLCRTLNVNIKQIYGICFNIQPVINSFSFYDNRFELRINAQVESEEDHLFMNILYKNEMCSLFTIVLTSINPFSTFGFEFELNLILQST